MRHTLTALAALGLLGGLGCYKDSDDPAKVKSSGTRAEKELADIRSRLPQSVDDGQRQSDEYARHITDSTVARERKAEVIRRRADPDFAEGERTIRELRKGVEELAGTRPNEWSRRLVIGTVEKAEGEKLWVEASDGTQLELRTDAVTDFDGAPQEGAEVRASYEVRDGAKVVTQLEVLKQ